MGNLKKLKTSEGIADVTNSSEPPIFKLNDDCARYIFSFLHMKQRIQIQRVCKRWQRISQLPWSDLKKLDLTAPLRYTSNPDPTKFKYDLPILKQVLSLCGSSITHMILPDFHMTTSSDLLILIKKMCPSLRSLNFHGIVITRKTAQFIAENFSELIEITIYQCWPKCEDFLAQFFTNNKRLRSINIYGSNRIKGASLLGLPESLTEIYINDGDDIQPELFCNVNMLFFEKLFMKGLKNTELFLQALQKLINLHRLAIIKSVKLLHKFDSFIDAMPNKFNIKELDLHSATNTCANKLIHIKNIGQMTNLRKLVLTGNLLLHDEILVNIGAHCQNLKIVHFHNSNRVTNSGWQSFTATLDLEELKVDDLSQLADKFFATMSMPSLKILKCYRCHRLNQKTFKKLIPRLENLERLDVFRCGLGYFNWEIDPFIKKMFNALNNRKNGKALEMHISSEEETRKVLKTSQLVLIREKEFCAWK